MKGQEFETKFQREVPLFSKDNVKQNKGSLYAKNQLDQCNHFDTMPASDSHTDHRHWPTANIHASIASHW